MLVSPPLVPALGVPVATWKLDWRAFVAVGCNKPTEFPVGPTHCGGT